MRRSCACCDRRRRAALAARAARHAAAASTRAGGHGGHSGHSSGGGGGLAARGGLLAALCRTPSWVVLLGVVIAGAVAGAAFPNDKLAFPWSVVQSATGWTYTAAWSLSFYPQVLLNLRRGRVDGLSLDFLALNLLGWVAYAGFNCAIFFVFECPRHPRAPAPAAAMAGAAGAAAAALLPGSASSGGGGGGISSAISSSSGAAAAAAALLQQQQQQQQQPLLWWQAAGLAPSFGSASGLAGSGVSALAAGPLTAPAAPFSFLQSAASAASASQSPHLVGESDFCRYAVEANDVAFSLHALALTLVTLLQCCVLPRGRAQRVHPAVVTAIAAAVAAAAAYAAAVAFAPELMQALPAALLARFGLRRRLEAALSWVRWLYFLSFIKMAVTLVKYVPQAVLNCRRRSTRGWSVLNVLLDLLGGALSLGQQLLTCWYARSLAPITANPVKLGLALTSMAMDLVFVLQHYALYPESRKKSRRAAAGKGGGGIGGGGGDDSDDSDDPLRAPLLAVEIAEYGGGAAAAAGGAAAGGAAGGAGAVLHPLPYAVRVWIEDGDWRGGGDEDGGADAASGSGSSGGGALACALGGGGCDCDCDCAGDCDDGGLSGDGSGGEDDAVVDPYALAAARAWRALGFDDVEAARDVAGGGVGRRRGA